MSDPEWSHLNDIPVRVLTCSCRKLLSQMLNPDQPLLTSEHLARDYRGLAELMGFSYGEIRNFQRASDPTAAILEEWETGRTTLGQLMQMFEKMERYDVIDESLPLMKAIAVNYQEREKEKPLQVAEVSSCPQVPCVSSSPEMMTLEDIDAKNELMQGGHRYDAYVCYADEDLEFVRYLVIQLENAGLKLYVRERDSLVGLIEYDAMVRLLSERCNYVLIILSPEFVKSPQCEFQAKFAAGLAIEQRQRKLIPVIYKTCTIPTVITYLTKLDFTRIEMRDWAWVRLIASLSAGNQNFAPQTTSPNSLPSLLSPPTSISSLSPASRSPEPEHKPHRKFLRKLKFPSSSSSASSGFVSPGSSYERIPQ